MLDCSFKREKAIRPPPNRHGGSGRAPWVPKGLITMVEGQLLAAAPAPPQQSFCSPILRCSSDLGKPSAFDLGPAPAPAASSTFTTPIKARADPLKSMWSGEGDAAAEGASKEVSGQPTPTPAPPAARPRGPLPHPLPPSLAPAPLSYPPLPSLTHA